MKGQCSMKSFLLYDDCNLRRFPLLLLKNRFIWFWFILCCRWNWLNEQHVLYFAILVVFDQSIGWISRFLKMSKHCTTIEGLWYQTLISTVVFFLSIQFFRLDLDVVGLQVRCESEALAKRVSQQINYAKSVHEENRHTLLTTNWPPSDHRPCDTPSSFTVSFVVRSSFHGPSWFFCVWWIRRIFSSAFFLNSKHCLALSIVDDKSTKVRFCP